MEKSFLINVCCMISISTPGMGKKQKDFLTFYFDVVLEREKTKLVGSIPEANHPKVDTIYMGNTYLISNRIFAYVKSRFLHSCIGCVADLIQAQTCKSRGSAMT